MSEVVMYGVTAGAVIVAGGVWYWFAYARSGDALNRGQVSDKRTIEAVATPVALPEPPSPESLALGADLDFLDSTGNVVFNTRELQRLPPDAVILDDAHGVALSRGRQLAADVFKGAVGLPGKTVEIVFDPEIQRGLADGTLEVVSAVGGGARAMARRTDNGQIAGHARILEGGRVKQMAAGAFQLLSIAVAQSHLDDINRNLNAIKDDVAGIREFLDIKDKSKLAGAVEYLSRVVSLIQKMTSPGELRSEKKGEMEAISREVSEWIEQLQLEVKALKKKIAAASDQDTFGGTESTFCSLKRHAEAAHNILEKRNLLLRIMALLRLCEAYMAPLEVDSLPQSWTSGSSAIAADFEELTAVLRDKANQLLSRALWNKQETLESRRREVVAASELVRDTAREEFAAYDSLMERININLKRLGRVDGKIRMAVSFDAESNVRSVALV